MKILCSGGAGFLGSHLVERLASGGVDGTVKVWVFVDQPWWASILMTGLFGLFMAWGVAILRGAFVRHPVDAGGGS